MALALRHSASSAGEAIYWPGNGPSRGGVVWRIERWKDYLGICSAGDGLKPVSRTSVISNGRNLIATLIAVGPTQLWSCHQLKSD